MNYEYIFSSISPIGTVGGKNTKPTPPAPPKPAEKAPEPAAAAPNGSSSFDAMVKAAFPGAVSNTDLKAKAVEALSAKGYTPEVSALECIILSFILFSGSRTKLTVLRIVVPCINK